MAKKKYKLTLVEKEDKAFDYVCTVKRDAYSMPSKFYAATVYYPETEEDTQTYYTQIQADMYFQKEKIGTIKKSDEFDTAKDAKKWIFEIFEEFLRVAAD